MSNLGFGTRKSEYVGYYKLAIKDQSHPVIEKIEKIDGEWQPASTEDNITFRIIDLRVASRDTDKYGKRYSVEIDMDLDDGGKSKISVNLNSIGKNILNTLASVKDLPNSIVSLSVYTRNKDGQDYAAVYIEVNGNKGEWKLGVDKLKAMDKDHKWEAFAEKFIIPQFTDFTWKPEDSEDDLVFETTEEPATESEEDDLPW